ALLLPQMEQENIYRRLTRPTSPGAPDPTTNPGWFQVNPDFSPPFCPNPTFMWPTDESIGAGDTENGPLIVLAMPSATFPAVATSTGGLYYAIGGSTTTTAADVDFGKTNYIGCGGGLGSPAVTSDPAAGGVDLTQYVGVFYNRSKT